MDDESTSGEPAGLFRRLAALLYDLILAAALVLAAGFAMLPFMGGKAVTHATHGAVGYAYHAVMLVVVFGYFGWSWTRTGQTLGMRAWRIRLVSAQGRLITWGESLVRFLLGAGLIWTAAIGGWYLSRAENPLAATGAVALLIPLSLNYAWIAFDAERRSLMDLAGRMRVLAAA